MNNQTSSVEKTHIPTASLFKCPPCPELSKNFLKDANGCPDDSKRHGEPDIEEFFFFTESVRVGKKVVGGVDERIDKCIKESDGTLQGPCCESSPSLIRDDDWKRKKRLWPVQVFDPPNFAVRGKCLVACSRMYTSLLIILPSDF